MTTLNKSITLTQEEEGCVAKVNNMQPDECIQTLLSLAVSISKAIGLNAGDWSSMCAMEWVLENEPLICMNDHQLHRN